MKHQTCLVELGTEELPAGELYALGVNFAESFHVVLDAARFEYGQVEWFATPRRIAVKIFGLSEYQQDTQVLHRGPKQEQAFTKEGVATPAGLGWAKRCGIALTEAVIKHTDKGSWLFHEAHHKGGTIHEHFPRLLREVVEKLSLTRTMHWGDRKDRFIRPVRKVTALFGNTVLDAELFGVRTTRELLGHRFMGKSPLILEQADHYPSQLETEGKVVADYAVRRSMIRSGIEQLAVEQDAYAQIPDSLLDEVTGLVEWPVVLLGSFDPRFLALPTEAIAQTMMKDQRYFPLYDRLGTLLPQFVFVANTQPASPIHIIEGNGKVIRSRLEDAEFFFQVDKKQPFATRLPLLRQMQWHPKLGTMEEKVLRLVQLSRWIAHEQGVDELCVTRAATLSKHDLTTEMVRAFPEIQGVIGGEYARQAGEDAAVAAAIAEQYYPKFSGDRLPKSPAGAVLALADKLDHLVGLFGIGATTKSDKDPFALRRAALGCLRIVLEKNLTLDLGALIDKTLAGFAGQLTQPNLKATLTQFLMVRLRGWYREKGVPPQIIEAVTLGSDKNLLEIDRCIKALTAAEGTALLQGLIRSYQRVNHFLVRGEGLTVSPPSEGGVVLLPLTPIERTLAVQIDSVQADMRVALKSSDPALGLRYLGTLSEPITEFFETVHILVEDLPLRCHRIGLVMKLQALFSSIADFSVLTTQAREQELQ